METIGIVQGLVQGSRFRLLSASQGGAESLCKKS